MDIRLFKSGGKEKAVRYLIGLTSSLRQRGIQAILLAGCILSFGLGQVLGADYGPHAYHAYNGQIGIAGTAGKEGTAARARQVGGGLGNNLTAQQSANTGSHTRYPAAQSATSQSMPLATPATLEPPGKGHSNQDDKEHQKGNGGGEGKDNRKGERHGKGGSDEKSPKVKGHHTRNDGGPHNVEQKQGKRSQGADGGEHHNDNAPS